jgi:hypothetical protein
MQLVRSIDVAGIWNQYLEKASHWQPHGDALTLMKGVSARGQSPLNCADSVDKQQRTIESAQEQLKSMTGRESIPCYSDRDKKLKGIGYSALVEIKDQALKKKIRMTERYIEARMDFAQSCSNLQGSTQIIPPVKKRRVC